MILTKIICISIWQIMPKLSLKLAIIYARLISYFKIVHLTNVCFLQKTNKQNNMGFVLYKNHFMGLLYLAQPFSPNHIKQTDLR